MNRTRAGKAGALALAIVLVVPIVAEAGALRWTDNVPAKYRDGSVTTAWTDRDGDSVLSWNDQYAVTVTSPSLIGNASSSLQCWSLAGAEVYYGQDIVRYGTSTKTYTLDTPGWPDGTAASCRWTAMSYYGQTIYRWATGTFSVAP